MRTTRFISSLIAILSAFPLASASLAATVWTGPMITFSKAGFADPALEANQDRLTSDVWITRGEIRGLYNAFSEMSFTRFSSPVGTEWAYGTTADFASLSYTDWDTWANSSPTGGPPGTVGLNAVVHLTASDVYLDLTFLSWGGNGSGGTFSYERSTPAPIPEPAGVLTGLLCLGLSAIRRRRR